MFVNAVRKTSFSLSCWMMLIAATASPAFSQLRFTISSPVRQIYLNEAVPLSVTITNTAETSESFDSRMFMLDDENDILASLRIVVPDSTTRTLRKPALALEHTESGEKSAYHVLLASGESKSMDLLISCDWDDFSAVFSDAGVYSVSMIYITANGITVSNTIYIRVLSPPLVEQEALALVRQMRHPAILYEPRLLLWYRNRSEEWRADMDLLAELHESTVYANYARLSLALYHLALAEMPGITKGRGERAQALQTAGRYLSAIRSNNFTLMAETEKARKTLENLKNDSSGR